MNHNNSVKRELLRNKCDDVLNSMRSRTPLAFNGFPSYASFQPPTDFDSNDLHNYDKRDWIPIPNSTTLDRQSLKVKHHFVPEPDWVPPVQSAQQRVPRPRSRGVKLRSVEAIVNDTQRQKSSLSVDERTNHSSAKTSPRQQKPAPQPPKSKVLDFLNEITAVSRSNPSSNKATPVGNSTTSSSTSQNGISKKHQPTTPIKKPSDTSTTLIANAASSHPLKKTSSSSSSSSRQNGIEKSSNIEKSSKSTTSMKTKPMNIDFDILLTKQYLVNDLDDPAATRHLEDLTKINIVKKRPILRVRIALKKPIGRKEISNKKEIKKKITNDTQSHVTPSDNAHYNLPTGTIPTEFIRNMKIPKKSKSDKTPASTIITKSVKTNVMELEEGETISPSPSPRYQQNSPPPPSSNRNTTTTSSTVAASSSSSSTSASISSKSNKRHREHREKISGSTEEPPRRSKIARKETSSSSKYINDNEKEKEKDEDKNKHQNNSSNGYTNTSSSIKKEKYSYDDERRPSSSSKRAEHNSSDDNNEKRKSRRDSGSSRKDEESSSSSRYKSLQKSSSNSSSKRRRSRSRSPSRSNSPLRRSSSSSVERSSRRHTPTSKELHKSSSSSSIVKEKSSSSNNNNVNNGSQKDISTANNSTTTNSKSSIVKNPSSSSISSSSSSSSTMAAPLVIAAATTTTIPATINDTPAPSKINKIKYPPATAENAESPDQYRVFSMMFQKLAKFYKRRGDTQEKEIYSILDHFHAFLNYILAFHFIDKQGTDGLNWDTLHPFSVVLIKKMKSWGGKEKKDTLLLGLCLRMNALVHFYLFHRQELATRTKVARISAASSNLDDQKKTEYAKLADKVFNEHETAYTNLRDSEKYLSFEDIQSKFPITYQNVLQLGELGPGIVIGGEAGVSVSPMYPLVPFSKLNHAAIMAKCMLQEYVDREKLNYQPITKVEEFM